MTAGPPTDEGVVDVPERGPVTASDVVFESTRVVSVRRDTVAPPSG